MPGWWTGLCYEVFSWLLDTVTKIVREKEARKPKKGVQEINLAAIQECCCEFAKVIGWRLTKGGRLCRTSLKGWLVKHFLKAEPTLGGFALVRVLCGHLYDGMCDSR